MYLIMRLDGKELEKISFHSHLKVSQEITRLIEKFKKEIASAGVDPQFTIENVPSALREFKSLKET